MEYNEQYYLINVGNKQVRFTFKSYKQMNEILDEYNVILYNLSHFYFINIPELKDVSFKLFEGEI